MRTRLSLLLAMVLGSVGCAPPLPDGAASDALSGYVPLVATDLENATNASILVDGITTGNRTVLTSANIYDEGQYPISALVDLGAVYDVAELDLFHREGGGTLAIDALRVGGSTTDDADYVRVQDHSASMFDGWETVTPTTAVRTRYLRLSIESYATYYGFSEVRVRGTLAPTAPVGPTPSVTASILVHKTTTLSQITPGFGGLSYEKSHINAGFFTGSNADLIALFRRLGPGLLRIGGNSVDEITYMPSGAGHTTYQVARSDIDGLAAFLSATGWKVLYGVRLAGSTPSAAADEAAYVASKLGASLYAFEIGNEPDLYGTNEGTAYSYAAFKASWEAFEAAMRASAPGALFTGAATANSYTTWTVPFAHDEASRIAMLTQHWYAKNGSLASTTIDSLLQPSASLVTELQALSAAAKAAHIPGGYRFTETNSLYDGAPQDVAEVFGGALWVVDYLFTQARWGSAGVNLHGGGNRTDYTPIADGKSLVVGPRAEYYGLAFFALVGTGTLVDATVSTTAHNLGVYAVHTTEGAIDVVLVNKSRTDVVGATIDFGETRTHVNTTSLTAPSIDATTGFALGRVSIGIDGSGTPVPENVPLSGTKATVVVPAGSALLVHAS